MDSKMKKVICECLMFGSMCSAISMILGWALYQRYVYVNKGIMFSYLFSSSPTWSVILNIIVILLIVVFHFGVMCCVDLMFTDKKSKT